MKINAESKFEIGEKVYCISEGYVSTNPFNLERQYKVYSDVKTIQGIVVTIAKDIPIISYILSPYTATAQEQNIFRTLVEANDAAVELNK